jgi:nucleoside diphosphate kinase
MLIDANGRGRVSGRNGHNAVLGARGAHGPTDTRHEIMQGNMGRVFAIAVDHPLVHKLDKPTEAVFRGPLIIPGRSDW